MEGCFIKLLKQGNSRRKEVIILEVFTGNSFLLTLASLMTDSFGKRGSCMVGNMAATDAEESPKPGTFTSEDVEKSGQTSKWTVSDGAVHSVHETSPRKATENPGDTLTRDDGPCVSRRSYVSVESSGGTSRATRKSADKPKPVENMKEAPAVEQRAFDACEMQENDGEETKTPGQENGMQTRYEVVCH